jgi:hypothetical protein
VIEVALQKLNQLNVTEGLTVTAQILEHTVQGEKRTWLVISWALNTPLSRWKGNAR